VTPARGGILLIALVVVIGLLLFAFDLPRIAADEMAPNIRKGDLLLACRVCGTPRAGDVVLFSPPGGDGPLQIRRIVGVPGDRVEVHRGEVRLNGQPLDDRDANVIKLPGIDPLSTQPRPFRMFVEHLGDHDYRVVRDLGVTSTTERPPETLEDRYFLLADRRTLARDSRDYGPVRRAQVRSIVLRVLTAGDNDAARQTRLP
jgi:signal peptidase I